MTAIQSNSLDHLADSLKTFIKQTIREVLSEHYKTPAEPIAASVPVAKAPEAAVAVFTAVEVTNEMIIKLFQQLMLKKGGRDEALNILNSFNVRRIPDIAPTDYPTIHERLVNALGGDV